MKIGIDLRFIKDDLYSAFTLELVEELIKKDKKSFFIIYTNISLEISNFSNVEFKKVLIKNGSLKEQFKYNSILKSDKNNIMIFFNHYKPFFYKGLYYTFLYSLKEVYYSNFSNYFEKYKFLLLLEHNLKKSSKIICFDKNTSDELIEKYNIHENQTSIIDGFFPYKNELSNIENLNIDIKIKYNIKNDYFVYSGGEGVEKNYERLVYVLKKIKEEGKNIDLVFLGEAISKNIPLRNLILKLNLQENIFFMGVIKKQEKYLIYKNSLGTLFSSFYEPFPFRLTEPLFLNQKIISSDLKNIKNIFGDNIGYFSAISVNSIYNSINNYLENRLNKNDYKDIIEKYTKENTANQLLEIIK